MQSSLFKIYFIHLYKIPLKHHKRLNVIKTKDNEIGKKTFQHKRINWSILYLGNEARTQMKKNNIIEILKDRTKESKIKGFGNTEIQPPMNIIVVKALISIIELYSAKKKRANPILAYSTLYPLTSSLSASGKSKGALLVSAKILTRNMKKIGNRGARKNRNSWNKTILKKFKEPTQTKTIIKINPIDTS